MSNIEEQQLKTQPNNVNNIESSTANFQVDTNNILNQNNQAGPLLVKMEKFLVKYANTSPLVLLGFEMPAIFLLFCNVNLYLIIL